MNVLEWLDANSFGVLIGLLLVSVLLINYFQKRKAKKKESKKEAIVPLHPEFNESQPGKGLFNGYENKSALDSLQDQKEKAEQWIKYLEGEGKKLVAREHEHLNGLAEIKEEKKQLGLKYTSWQNQIGMLDKMINWQLDYEKKMKEMNQ